MFEGNIFSRYRIEPMGERDISGHLEMSGEVDGEYQIFSTPLQNISRLIFQSIARLWIFVRSCEI